MPHIIWTLLELFVINNVTQVSIRAYLPIWAFLYVLQFLLMPLIAQDYWVSNLFGNTMYLMALSYYFAITFLGYNGMRLLQHPQQATQLTFFCSITIPKQNGGATGAYTRAPRPLADQPVHIRLRDESGAGPLVRSEVTETCLTCSTSATSILQ